MNVLTENAAYWKATDWTATYWGPSVLAKWRTRRQFQCYSDGNKTTILGHVSLRDAIANFRAWYTDWDLGLTEEEKTVVRDESWRSAVLRGNDLDDI